MDVQMPLMDGLTATSLIRSLEKGLPPSFDLPEDLLGILRYSGHVPMVAMTAHAMGGDQEMCLAAGMDGYITKPFQPTHLTETLSSLADRNPSLAHVPSEKDGVAPFSSQTGSSVFLSVPALVIAHLQATSSLNAAQIDRVLAAARQSITDNLAKAGSALAAEEYTELGLFAHTLKGTLLQCGLNELAEKAEEIHLGVRTSSDLPYDNLLEHLNSSLAAMIATENSNGGTN